ncbi:MAG TPA: pyruvate, water dikinase regulatory protein [Deltaproteobacteria bacterium]|nr:pyruvate, water dikinase regulatory protein [Deltaproteobacteria bacterium]HOI08098.1 pyruvate, water dikinase regulatory protein [Deltaproteobacteria bacterium]
MPKKKARGPGAFPPVYIVSGGTGTSGEAIVNTVLAQFPDLVVPMVTVGNVRDVEEIVSVVEQARTAGGTIVHTLVDGRLREALTSLAASRGVAEVDLMGPLMGRLTSVLCREPLGMPGLYRKLRAEYFTRIEAIEYTLEHDDGQHPHGWPQADVMLVGLSRSGKTPLSVYLSVQGLKVANCPVVPGIPVPDELFDLDRNRVFGLIVDADRLVKIRSERIARIGISGRTPYSDPSAVEEEVGIARKLFRKGGFHVINMTDRTVEAIASEIVRRISRIG